MEPLESRKRILEQYKVAEGQFTYKEERCVSYYITMRDMPLKLYKMRLDHHVGYWGPELLFVSEAVPQEYRPYVLYHELLEFEELGGPATAGSCLRASQDELEQVPLEERSAYAKYRAKQFQSLLDAYSDAAAVFVGNLQASLQFWKDQIVP